MKIYPHLFHKLFCTPLLLLPSARHAFERELLGRMGVATMDHRDSKVPEAETRSESATRRMNAIMDTYGDVAVINVQGVIDKAMTDFEMDCYGGCDLNDVNSALASAQTNRSISTVVMNMNTPGGSATGVAETANRIAQLRQTKEVRSYIDSQCCSAGMWLASQCDRIDIAPSAYTGSIGVYMALLDQTKALEMEGLKVNLIKAGTFKAMGASFKELLPEERAMFQKSVDDLYAQFTAACTQLRKISPDAMQGQSFNGRDALAAGLVDGLTEQSLDEYVADLIGQ